MTNFNMNVYVYNAGDSGYDKVTNRYFTTLYIFDNKVEYFAEVSCSDYDTINKTISDIAIEFLDYKTMNNILMPYDVMMFSEIIEQAKSQFQEMKDDEAIYAKSSV